MDVSHWIFAVFFRQFFTKCSTTFFAVHFAFHFRLADSYSIISFGYFIHNGTSDPQRCHLIAIKTGMLQIWAILLLRRHNGMRSSLPNQYHPYYYYYYRCQRLEIEAGESRKRKIRNQCQRRCYTILLPNVSCHFFSSSLYALWSIDNRQMVQEYTMCVQVYDVQCVLCIVYISITFLHWGLRILFGY